MTDGRQSILCMALCGLLGGCGLLPVHSPGASAGSSRDDAYRQSYDACAARAAAEHGRTLELPGNGFAIDDGRDPLSPNNVAATRAHVELANCMRSRGWPGISR